ncbi:MAG TPA: xanthine dehydrogenase molybdopterin binding subunit [Verrucomicrobiae bacterium]|nr:xanthine dehydrogenase molybdopterin binding subunit [Verrucomicrobiae bacterium]
MYGALELTLNGRAVRVENCSPNLTLLEYLRGTGCTGSKEGCAEGDCGACSVAIVDRDARGCARFRAINSCLVPLSLLAGREVVTVEGVARDGELHPVQRAMVECHGSQCGYCTPGFIMSLFEGYYRGLREPWQVDEQLCGNLCRCTGYRPIREAAGIAFAQKSERNGQDHFAARLQSAPEELAEVNYEAAGEKFFRPRSLDELLKLLQKFPEARMIAGATEMGLEITKRFKKFPTLISIEATPELKGISTTATEWTVGAAMNLTQVDEALGDEYPALRDMLHVFGSRQIRNRATLGGNLVTASPIGDSAPVLLSLDAKVVIASLQGERTIPLSDFFIAYRKTALQPGEVFKSVIVPRGVSQPGLTRKSAWYKVSKRREMDISTVAGSFVVDLDAEGIVRHARLGYGGVAAMPSRAQKTEAALLGKVWNAESIRSVLPILATEFIPISDVRGAAIYRQGLITSLLEKFFSAECGVRSAELGNEEIAPPGIADLAVKRPPPHESAHKHVTGEAIYTDDQTSTRRMLETWPVCSPHARAKILKRDATAARTMPGIHAVLLAEDIPGKNDVGAVVHDEILLADKEVFFHGHIVALVVGDSHEACRAAAAKVVVDYEPTAPMLLLSEAVDAGSFHNEPNFIRRGDVKQGLASAPLNLEGEFEFGGQEHFYLETHAAWAEPGEDGSVRVTSSTQHPSEVQNVVAHVLHLPMNQIIVQNPRMGGGFGGKETQANTPAALAALAAFRTRRPARVRFNRDQDMMLLGHRHPFLARFHAGFDANGKLLALKAQLYSNGGWSMDLSQAVTDRALFHLDNSYYIPHVEFQGRVAKLNVSSNTAFRGFGGPQGMLVIEEIIDRIARRLNLPPEVVRERNLYHGRGETNTTHYGQEIEDNRILTVWDELKRSSELEKRREGIVRWNEKNPQRKRGIAMTPVKFGISFTVTHLNQAGALVLLYQDGTAQVNHGGTEMGQGLHTNIREIASLTLGLKTENIRVMQTSTDKVPNTSATAASAGTDLNGAAVKNACDILRERLSGPAAMLLTEKLGRAPSPEKLIFADGVVYERDRPETNVPIFAVIQKAYFERLSLSATGYYRTPDIHWDRVKGRGKPFHYFSYGAAVTEVEVDGFTGMAQVLRTDILHDVGNSVNAGVNRGQIEGGFIQGMGWLTAEELKWDGAGRLLTHSPDTYKIPAIGDTPRIFNVNFLHDAAQKTVVHGSKAVGEPPFMLAISVREAIRDAVAAFGARGGEVRLASPATCEAIFMAIQERRKINGAILPKEEVLSEK